MASVSWNLGGSLVDLPFLIFPDVLFDHPGHLFTKMNFVHFGECAGSSVG